MKNLSQQVAVQQTELATLRNAFALQQKTSAELVDQIKSTGEETQAALTTILARLEAGPLVERQPDFCKADAAAWLALRRDTLIPAHSAPKVELSSGIPDSSMQVVSHTQSLAIFERPCRVPASVLVRRLDHLPPLHSRSNPGSPDGACLQDRPPYHKTRCSIPHNGPRRPTTQTSSSASSAKASKPTGVFGKTTDIAVQTSLDQQPHLHHYHGRSSQSMLPTSATNVLLSAISSGTPGSGPSQRPASLHLNSALLSLDSMSSSIQPLGPGRRGIALGIPSCFGGHEHGSAVGTMILAKVPNFTPECLWIVGSVYVGHSGATTNYSRREAFASIRQALDRVVPFDNNHPVLILETGTPTHSAFSALSTRGVMV
ncbi:hypothetical protein BASA61_007946 [Batrachochytrium salamandrivorans]|nr:hypothetical protein BASA61_007946 [Batrachochytrium salamandrivorans]